jgi:hypothetical protein
MLSSLPFRSGDASKTMEDGVPMLDDDRDGDVLPIVILSKTKDVAKPGYGSFWAQILRHGLRMTIPTHKDLRHPRR